MHLKHSLLTIYALVASLLLSGCAPDLQKDIALFQPFIDANINTVSDDPYISSTVRPGDKFYDILVNLQHGRHDKAETRLLTLMEQDDVQAQYWYARLINGSSIKETPIALRLLKQVAETGDPYALFALSPKGGECMIYYGTRNCTEENFNKAAKIFKQRAQQGDLRAQYFLLRMFKPDGSRIRQQYYFTGGLASLAEDSYYLYHSDETRAFFIKEIIRFAEGHYYQPLMDYVNLVMPSPKYGKPFQGITPEHHQLVLNLLTIAANHNYLPAISRLVAINKEQLNKNDKLYQALLKLGGKTYFFTRSYWFSDEYSPQDLWVFARANEILSGDKQYFIGLDYQPTKQERTKLEIQAQVIVYRMTPMIYIDEFTGRNNWVDR